MYENFTKQAPEQGNMTVKSMTAETLVEAVNQPVGEKMRPNAVAAREQTAGTNSHKFLPTGQPTDAHQSRKDGFNKNTNYTSWSTTYLPSSMSKTTDASRQTPEQKEEKECREKIYAIPESEYKLNFKEKLKTLANKKVAFISFVKTLGTSTPEDVTEDLQPVKIHPCEHLEKVQRKDWYFARQKDLANQ
jgi:hypothetical protein